MNKDTILKHVQKAEDKLFLSKVFDKFERCRKTNQIVITDFMDPYQKKITESVVSLIDDLNFHFWGGFEGAEREALFVCPDFLEPLDLEWGDYFTAFCITVNGWEKLTHRDYLGALMGLGIKREKTGDILVIKGKAHFVVFNEIADYISYNLTKISKENVHLEKVELSDLCTNETKTKELSATVASLRIDCIASVGFGISRSKITDLIKAKKLNLNWEQVDNNAKNVKQGDTLSLRGKGRVVLETVGNISKKGRIFINIKRFI